MRNRLVPRTEWFRFFGEFSRRYQGWLVTVRVLHPSFGSQVEAREVPLEGVEVPPIVTLTINPCIDESAAVDQVVPDRKLRCGRRGTNRAAAVST